MTDKSKNNFEIPFSNLKDGIHNFEFYVDKMFFEKFEFSEFEDCNLKITIIFDKKPQMLSLNFIINGYVKVPCDVCLDIFELQIETNQNLFVKLENEYLEENDDIIAIPRHNTTFNCDQYIYEYICLALPMKRIHPNDDGSLSKCNPVMLKHLDNIQKKENSSNNPWEVLNKIK